MSGKLIGWAQRQRTGSPTLKAILYCLADHANENGVAWPSIKKIAAETELCRRTILNGLPILQQGGFINIERRYAGGGRNTTSLYRLNAPAEYFQQPASRRRRKVQGVHRDDEAQLASSVNDVHHLTNPQGEPPLNLRASGTLAQDERAAALERRIGTPLFESWFLEVDIVAGPPPVLMTAILLPLSLRYGLHLTARQPRHQGF